MIGPKSCLKGLPANTGRKKSRVQGGGVSFRSCRVLTRNKVSSRTICPGIYFNTAVSLYSCTPLCLMTKHQFYYKPIYDANIICSPYSMTK